MDFFEEYIDGSTRIASLSMGKKSGVPAIAIHGWLDNALSFGKLAPYLDFFQLKAIDLPGHGHSEHRGEGAQYHFIDWIPEVLHVADHFKFERFGLIGHSMGAGVASMVAGCVPDRIKFLVLIDGLGPVTSSPEELPLRVIKRMAASQKILHRPTRYYHSISQAVAARVLVGKFKSDDSIIEMVERNLKQENNHYYWSYDDRLKLPSSFRFSQEQVSAFLEKITCPLLIIRAKSGLPVVEKEITPQLQAVPHAEIIEIEGYHHLHMDTPAPVAEIINQFIQKI